MKRTLIALLLVVCLLLSSAPGVLAAGWTESAQDWLEKLPFATANKELHLFPAQAEEYAQAIRNAQVRVSADSTGSTKEVYVTFFDVNGSTAMWLCGIAISDFAPEYPGQFVYGNGSFWVEFMEIWEWDDTKAVAFPVVEQYSRKFSDLYIHLWPEGLEIYTAFEGTDVDGNEWDAFYPFTGGRIDTAARWCRAWAYYPGYRLEQNNMRTDGKTQLEIAQMFFEWMMNSQNWPQLPFDWTTLTYTDPPYDLTTVCGGTGYPTFRAGRTRAWEAYSRDSRVQLSFMDIGTDESKWARGKTVLEALENYLRIKADAPFDDVGSGDYYAPAVKWAVANKITNGVSDTAFAPASPVTRAQAMTFLWRVAGCPEPRKNSSDFVDVKEGSYYCQAVLWAVERGITNGTSDDTFSPDSTCTYAHMLTFLCRLAGADSTGGSNWYSGAVNWAKDNHLLTDIETGLNPLASCPRGDVVYILYNAVQQNLV